MNDLLTPREVCEMLNISYRTLLRWIDKGEIKVVKLNSGRIRVPRSEIEKMIKDEIILKCRKGDDKGETLICTVLHPSGP